jgi:hypothetical protein
MKTFYFTLPYNNYSIFAIKQIVSLIPCYCPPISKMIEKEEINFQIICKEFNYPVITHILTKYSLI